MCLTPVPFHLLVSLLLLLFLLRCCPPCDFFYCFVLSAVGIHIVALVPPCGCLSPHVLFNPPVLVRNLKTSFLPPELSTQLKMPFSSPNTITFPSIHPPSASSPACILKAHVWFQVHDNTLIIHCFPIMYNVFECAKMPPLDLRFPVLLPLLISFFAYDNLAFCLSTMFLFTASFAILPVFSFPQIPRWAGVHRNTTQSSFLRHFPHSYTIFMTKSWWLFNAPVLELVNADAGSLQISAFLMLFWYTHWTAIHNATNSLANTLT